MEKIIVAAIVLLALIYSARRLWHSMRTGSCSCGRCKTGRRSKVTGPCCPDDEHAGISQPGRHDNSGNPS
jgi:hypothetical protein